MRNQTNLSKKEFFRSKVYLDHLILLSTMVLDKALKNPRISVVEGEAFSCTDGNQIFVNVDDPDALFYTDMDTSIAAMDAVLFHECSHIRYLDFDKYERAARCLQKGELPVEVNPESEEEKERIGALRKKLQGKKFCRILGRIYQDIDNIISDSHDERKLMEKFPGYVSSSLTLMQSSMWQQLRAEEEIIEETEDEIAIMLTLIFIYARFLKIPMKESSHTDRYLTKMEEVKPFIEGALYTDDYDEKSEKILKIMLWILDLKDQEKESEEKEGDGEKSEDSSSDGEGKPDGENTSPEDNDDSLSDQLLNSISQAEKEIRETVTPINVTSSSCIKEVTGKKSEDGRMDLSFAKSARIQMEKEEEKKAQDQKIRQEEERELDKILLSDEESKDTEIYKDYPFGEREKLEYEGIRKEYSLVIERTRKKILSAFKEMEELSLLKNRPFGKKVDYSKAYRRDEKYFIKRKTGKNLPRIAVSILIDSSGSMSGERIEVAKKAAVLLTEVCEALSFPVMVSAHNSMGHTAYHLFYPFDGRKERKYSLMNIMPIGGNKDGAALHFSSKLLSKREESIKLLFLISDGRPSSYSSREEGIRHIREVLKQSKKENVEVIACAIADQENIRDIYGESFLDIERLEDLPGKLLKILKKRIFS